MKLKFTFLFFVLTSVIKPVVSIGQTASTADSLALVTLYDSVNGRNWTVNSGWLKGPVKNWYGVTLGATGRVTSINFYTNNLTGVLPAAIGQLTGLTYLSLAYNNLTGQLPASLGNLTQLTVLSLGANQLSGSVPQLSKLTNLQSLYLNGNNFTFDGMENIAQNFGSFAIYAPQNNLQIVDNNNILSVTAGGTLSNNTYTWFKDGNRIAQIIGNPNFAPSSNGVYSVQVTNSIATQLTLTSNSFLVSNITLPVTFVSFTAQATHGGSLLNWQTSTEINTAYFNIQRSNDGLQFTTIGKVNAAGNSNLKQSYNYTDGFNGLSAVPTTLYYRLQEVDKNGVYNYSKIIKLADTQNNPSLTLIYPNPAHDVLNMKLTGVITGQMLISITNIEGKQLLNQQTTANGNTLTLNTSSLSAGIYILRVQHNGQTEEQKFVKQ